MKVTLTSSSSFNPTRFRYSYFSIWKTNSQQFPQMVCNAYTIDVGGGVKGDFTLGSQCLQRCEPSEG